MTARSASRSTFPRESEGTGTTSKPLMAEVAGLVPWAESGIRIFVRFVSSTRAVICPDDTDANKFTLGTGGRFKADNRGKPLISLRVFLQVIHQRQVTLDGIFRLKWMGESKTGDPGCLFVDLGIVFHRARTQGIETCVNAVIQG